MSKSKVATKSSKKESKKPAPAVKEGRVTKPAQTPKAKSKELAKSAAAKIDKKSKKAKKAPTPEPESSSSESESEADSESESSESSSDDEVDTKAPAKTTGTAKAAPVKADAESSDSSDEDSDSSSSESDSEEETAPKASTVKANGVAAKESDSDSSDSDSESDEEEAPVKAKKVEKADASSDSDSDSESDSDDSDSSSGDEEEAPTKKRKAEEAAEPIIKKAKTEVADEGVKNLFVGNLSWNVDEEWLAREFEGFGEIVGCRIITDRETQRPKGFGYVEYATSESAAKAKEEMHGKDLDGRPLNVDFSTPRQNNANPKEKSNNRAARFGDKPSVPSNTLFIGNLSFDSTNESIHEAFSAYGEISRVSLPTDRDTGAPKGFGYVDFNTVDEAKAALEALNGYDVDGRPIRVDYATPRDNNGGGGGGRGGFGGGRGGGRGGFGGRGGGRGGRGGFGDRGGRGGRGGSRGSSTNRGGFGDFQGKKMSF